MSSIHDLPNELLDVIFSYVHPVIMDKPIVPIYTVCKRWNRPFMTQIVSNRRLPRDIDLQTKFPKLSMFWLDSSGKYYKDLSLFQGHAFLKRLVVYGTVLVAPVLICHRLTRLTLHISPELFFKDDNLDVFLTLLPRLQYLDIELWTHEELDDEFVQDFDQKLATVLLSRPKEQFNLRHLVSYIPYLDFISFCQLFPTLSLDHFETMNDLTTEQVVECLACFPKIRSLKIGFWSMYYFPDTMFEHITTLHIDGDCMEDTLSFSELLEQFPNMESLTVKGCLVIFDLEYPTRLTHSILSFTGVVQPRLFPHLKTLDWTIDPDQFNYVMQELGKHCFQLMKITVGIHYVEDVTIQPELDGVVFPHLTKIAFRRGDIELNASLVQFLARHGQSIPNVIRWGGNFNIPWN